MAEIEVIRGKSCHSERVEHIIVYIYIYTYIIYIHTIYTSVIMVIMVTTPHGHQMPI